MRRMSSRIGAVTPMTREPGSRPTMKVDSAMIMMAIRNVYLRPTRSPMRPKTAAPSGRTTKPAAKASRAKNSRVVRGN